MYLRHDVQTGAGRQHLADQVRHFLPGFAVGSRLKVAFPGDTRRGRVFHQEVQYSGLTAVRAQAGRHRNPRGHAGHRTGRGPCGSTGAFSTST